MTTKSSGIDQAETQDIAASLERLRRALYHIDVFHVETGGQWEDVDAVLAAAIHALKTGQ